jgi:chaperonin cofactor prefoldin
MDKVKYEVYKEDGKVVFQSVTKDLLRKEYVSEDYAREQYRELKKQKENILANISKLNKDIADNKVEKNPELEHFLELANNAAAYKKCMDLQNNLEGSLKMLESIEASIKPIENVLPEVKRMKK